MEESPILSDVMSDWAPPTDALDRTLLLAGRRRRRHRIQAATVALVVFFVPTPVAYLKLTAESTVEPTIDAGTAASPPVLLVTAAIAGDFARAEGVVTTHDECVFLRSGNSEMLVAWPRGTSARVAGDGRVEILNQDGDIIAREGQEVVLGGGSLSGPEGPGYSELVSQVPESCRTGEVWVTGLVLSHT